MRTIGVKPLGPLGEKSKGGDNSLAFSKRKGKKRVSGAVPLAFPTYKSQERAHCDNLLVLPKVRGKARVVSKGKGKQRASSGDPLAPPEK